MGPHPSDKAAALGELIDEVRSLFHHLKAAARDVHGGSNMAGGLRGVLVDLRENGRQTVPQMAGSRPVSRQHIQTLVNELRRGGLVSLEENPAHRRSKLVSLTPEGRRRATEMIARERRVLEALSPADSTDDIRRAARVLGHTRQLFQEPAWSDVLTSLE